MTRVLAVEDGTLVAVAGEPERAQQYRPGCESH